MNNRKLVVGMDFGTDSVRGLLVDAYSGHVISNAISYYKRWKKGQFCVPKLDQYRQHPLDYMESIDEVFTGLFKDNPSLASQVLAIGTNTTASTPVAVNESCTPLALLPDFAENPNAMFILWKDHTANQEADEINELADKWSINYTKYSGGIYSSEWFFSKILHINRIDKKVKDAAFSWIEQSDWIPAYLSGTNKVSEVKRNRCAAGHKAMWNAEYNGLPSSEFLCSVDPNFYSLVNKLYKDTYTSDEVYGSISSYFVEKYGFSPETIITVGGVDAHHGAVGAGIKPYSIVKVIGTSTCDMLVIPNDVEYPIIDGICGQVDGSIEPGKIGYEAGQSAFGDIYNWYKKTILKPTLDVLSDDLSEEQISKLENNFFKVLTEQASKKEVTNSDLIFTDYHNGRRTPDVDYTKEAAAYGFTLSTDSADIFKALVEGTAFGSKAIIERFKAFDIDINNVIATGGIANKSPYVVQVLSDVLNCNIDVVDSDQTCALGAAIFAATAAGVYQNVDDAKSILAAKIAKTYTPNVERVKTYESLYSVYQELTKF